MTASRRLPARYRLAVASRALAALGGGYALASAVAAASAVLGPAWLDRARSEATVGGTMLGFLAYATAFLLVFACRKAWQAWAWVLGPAALLGAATWLAGAR